MNPLTDLSFGRKVLITDQSLTFQKKERKKAKHFSHFKFLNGLLGQNKDN